MTDWSVVPPQYNFITTNMFGRVTAWTRRPELHSPTRAGGTVPGQWRLPDGKPSDQLDYGLCGPSGLDAANRIEARPVVETVAPTPMPDQVPSERHVVGSDPLPSSSVATTGTPPPGFETYVGDQIPLVQPIQVSPPVIRTYSTTQPVMAPPADNRIDALTEAVSVLVVALQKQAKLPAKTRKALDHVLDRLSGVHQ